MATLGSAPMDFSNGTEGVISKNILANGLILRSDEESANEWKSVPCKPTNIQYTGQPPRNSFHSRVRWMRRSSLGEVHSYKEIRQIGSGGFGNCFLLERKSDEARRVCKVQAREYQDEERCGVPLEVTILRDLLPRHDRILHLHEFVLQPSTVQLYYNHYEGGDLYQLIGRYYDQWQDIPETFLWHVYLQMSEAVAFLHYGYDRRQLHPPPADWTAVIHGDIKDKNIFLGPPDPSSNHPLAREYPSLVLGDFGMADLAPSYRLGTPQWQPPELPITSMKADVWALGAVMHALAHEGRPPIAPLPRGFTWEDWCEFPDSRQPVPLYGLYSDELHDCVFSALALCPDGRLNSFDLHYKVMKEWCFSIGPYCGEIKPLIAAMESKCYNENGATIGSTANAAVVEQKIAGIDAVDVCIPLGNELPLNQTERKIKPTWSIIGKKRAHSQIASGAGRPIDMEKQELFKKAKTSGIVVDRAMPIMEDATRPTILGDYTQDFVSQSTWLSPKELMVMRMQDSALSSPLLSPSTDEDRYDNKDGAIESVINDLELQTVAAVVYSEDMASDTEVEQAAQLHTALTSTIGGTHFEIDWSGWFTNAVDRIYIFHSASEKDCEAGRSRRRLQLLA